MCSKHNSYKTRKKNLQLLRKIVKLIMEQMKINAKQIRIMKLQTNG